MLAAVDITFWEGEGNQVTSTEIAAAVEPVDETVKNLQKTPQKLPESTIFVGVSCILIL